MDELYSKVFDSDGKVKTCGREVCKELIGFCQDNYPGLDYGSIDTGIMNIESIQKAYKEHCEAV